MTCAASAIENLPPSFYDRPGLEKMPRIDYTTMPAVNVRDFGAKGDGVTDERPAFDKAVAALPPEGGVVFIPAGDYFFPAGVLPDRNSWAPRRADGAGLKNVHFVGEGDRSAIIYHFSASETEKKGYYIWNLGDAENCSVRDIRFSTAPLLDQRWVPGIGSWSLSFNKSKNIQVLRVVFDQGRMGTVFWNGNENTWVVGCAIRNTGADSIHFNDSTGTTVAYNYIENSGDDGIAMVAQGLPPGEVGHPTRDIRYIHNTVLGVRWGRGILLSGENMDVSDNWIEATVWPGVYLQSRGHSYNEKDVFPPVINGQVRRNTIVRTNLASRADNFNSGGLGFIGAVHGGLLVTSSTIEGNLILAGQTDGIEFGDPESLKGKELTIRNNRIFANLGSGIRLRLRDGSELLRAVIENNDFAGNKDGAVRISGAVREVLPADAVSLTQAETSPIRDTFAQVRVAPPETDWQLLGDLPTTDLQEINVRDFGAVGDGSTDDRAAFVKALAALPAGGGVLRVPAGQYLINPAPDADSLPDTAIKHHLLIRDAQNVHLIGDGPRSEIIFTSDTHQGLRILNSGNCSVRNLAVRLANPPAYRKNRALIDVAACHGILLDHLTLSDSGGPGALLNASRQVTVQHCTIDNAGTEGINIASTRQALVTGNTVTGSRDHGVKVGWVASGIARSPQFVRIGKNRISHVSQGAGIGVVSGDAVEVSGNTIDDACLAGIALYDQARIFSSQRVSVVENLISNAPSRPDLSYAKGAISMWSLRSKNPGPRYEFRIADNRFGPGTPTPISYSPGTCVGFKSFEASGNMTSSGSSVDFSLPPASPAPASN